MNFHPYYFDALECPFLNGRKGFKMRHFHLS